MQELADMYTDSSVTVHLHIFLEKKHDHEMSKREHHVNQVVHGNTKEFIKKNISKIWHSLSFQG